MAESADINVDELRRRARRRLVGAVVLALGVAVVVPMLLETEQKPLGDDVSVKIPPIDDSKFVNRLSENRAKDGARVPAIAPPPATDPAKAAPSPPVTATPPGVVEPPPKYDTRVPDAPSGGAPAPAAPAMPAPPETGPVAKRGADGGVVSGTRPPGAKPAPSPPATAPKSDPNAPPKAAPATPQDGFAVQLAAFADDKGANALAGRLKKAGFAAYTEPLQTSKGTLWRVRVGPYPSREAAVAARDKLKSEGQSGIVAALK